MRAAHGWMYRITPLVAALLVMPPVLLARVPGEPGGTLRADATQRARTVARAAEDGSTLATLTVTNRHTFPLADEPVTSGIPLGPETTVTSAQELSLVGPAGPVDSQLAVTARWGGAPGDDSKPIRWLLADFAADVQMSGETTYQLVRTGQDPVTEPIVTTEDSSAITIDTGRAVFEVSKSRFGLLDSVTPAGAARRDLAGTPIVAVDREGNSYSSTSATPELVSIETSGPMRVTIRLQGPLRGTAGDLLDCTAWLHFYRDAARVKADLRVENRRPPAYADFGQPDVWDIGSPRSVWIGDLSVRLPTTAGSAGSATFGTDSGDLDVSLTATASIYQDSSGNNSWNLYGDASHPRLQSYTSFRGYRLTRGGTQLDAGNHAPGWAVVGDPGSSTGVAVRRFRQQFPKAIRVGANGTVEVGLFPQEFASDHNLRAGEYKTHELLLDFDPRADFAARAALFDRPPVAAATPEHYARTQAFGISAPRTETTASAYEDANRRTLEPNAAYPYDWPPNASMLQAVDDYGFYGWQDFGDVPLDYEPAAEGAGQMNLKYNFDWGMWTQWARTADERWFDLADAGSRHIADIDILHAPNAAPHWANGGYFGHSYHDEPGNTNPNRNYGAPHPDLTFGVPGMLALHYMTGSTAARESAMEIADNIAYRFDNTFGGNGEGYAFDSPDVMNNSERSLANGLRVLTEAYRATADPKYLRTARAVVAHARADDQPYIDGPTGAGGDFIKPWALNMYLGSLGRYLDMLDEFGLPDTEDGRASLLRYADFHLANTYRPLPDGRAAFPYEWRLDATDDGPDVCDWLLAGADAMSFAYRRSGDSRYIEAAGRLFATGSADPAFSGDEPVYWWTKEAANNAVFGHVYLATVWDGAPPVTRRTTTLSARNNLTLVGYRQTVAISGSLQTGAEALPGRADVSLWGRPAAGGSWTRRVSAVWRPSDNTYHAGARLTENTVLQMRFSGDATFSPSLSDGVTVRAHAYLSRPGVSSTAVGRNRTFYVWGHLAPRHGRAVLLRFYRWSGARWSSYSRVTAAGFSAGDVLRYRSPARIRHAGRYRVRAYHSDGSHAPTYSAATVFTVR